MMKSYGFVAFAANPFFYRFSILLNLWNLWPKTLKAAAVTAGG